MIQAHEFMCVPRGRLLHINIFSRELDSSFYKQNNLNYIYYGDNYNVYINDHLFQYWIFLIVFDEALPKETLFININWIKIVVSLCWSFFLLSPLLVVISFTVPSLTASLFLLFVLSVFYCCCCCCLFVSNQLWRRGLRKHKGNDWSQ